jgi:predicted PurR-regulated permease PerM
VAAPSETGSPDHLLLLPSSLRTEAGGDGSTPAGAPGPARRAPASWAEVPWRTILATIGLVVATALTILALYLASEVVVLMLVAGFFAIVLNRPVRAIESRFGLRTGPAIAVVVGVTALVTAGLVTLFVLPVRTQLVAAVTDLPGTVQQASQGRGPVGHLVTKLHLVNVVRDHESTLSRFAASVERSLPSFVGSLLRGVLTGVTVVVLTCILLTQSEHLSRVAVQLVPMRHRSKVRTMANDAASAVSGYMIGNLIISLCAGASAFVVLMVLGVPSAIVLALWVAFADLIPLVGATIGAVVAVLAAFFVSTTAGIVAAVFFALYQQFENSVLQVVIMSKRVSVNPLTVLLSVLIGVDLFGFAGALQIGRAHV